MRAASRRSSGTVLKRLVQAERHVPGLRGEDREDRRAFVAEQAARKERDEAGHGDRQEAQDRHRLQDVEHRDQDFLGPPALGGERRVGEAEDQRGDERQAMRSTVRSAYSGRLHGSSQIGSGSPELIGHAHRRPPQAISASMPSTSGSATTSQTFGPQPRRPGDEGQAPALFHDPSRLAVDLSRRMLPLAQPHVAAKR